MPIYEYECTSCGKVFDQRRAVDDRDAPQACPACAAAECRRRISASSFELKGGGWYKDGYHK
jgi:hypothetical protein